MSEIELRECPFCGGDEAELNDLGIQYYVYCRDCGAETLPSMVRADAVTNWNTRPRQSELEGIIGDLVEPQVGSWMSAALDDPNVCDVMKADIRAWFDTLTRARKMLEG